MLETQAMFHMTKRPPLFKMFENHCLTMWFQLFQNVLSFLGTLVLPISSLNGTVWRCLTTRSLFHHSLWGLKNNRDVGHLFCAGQGPASHLGTGCCIQGVPLGKGESHLVEGMGCWARWGWACQQRGQYQERWKTAHAFESWNYSVWVWGIGKRDADVYYLDWSSYFMSMYIFWNLPDFHF